MMDAVLLARAQFAFTVSFHFIFPAFSIGLASYLMVLEGLWLKTGRGVYANLYRYWLKIFAVAFGMGVVSGLVMSYQFGTNWSVFSTKAGPVIGPLMAYEVLTAFFLEAGFLGVMLFGISKVGRGLHFFATCMVALGTFISAFWILSANSWMQTPAGYAINAKGQFVPAGSWLPIIFNPSFPFRLVHTVIAAYLTTALVVGGVGAWHLLKDRTNPGARKMFSMAMWMAALVAPIQILAGDAHGLNTLEHQPAKVLAMEGDYHPSPDGAPLILFGLPSNAEARVRYEVAIPKMGSLILKHDLNAPLPGLDRLPARQVAARADRVLVVPDHGRARLGHARPRPLEPARSRATTPLRLAMAAPCRRRDGAGRLRRGHRGLGDDRGRPPALYRLRPVGDRALALAAGRAGGGRLAARVRAGLFLRVRGRHDVSSCA